MSWLAEEGAWKANKTLKKLFKGRAQLTQHFVVRLYQRFDVIERRKILHELYFLLKSDMYQALFEQGEEHAKVMINNDIALCVRMSPGGRLVLKTIFPAGR